MSREPASVRIVALGDSTTAGTPGFFSPLEVPPAGRGDVTSQYAWWLMKAHPEWEVLNRGVNGERSDQIRKRLKRDVLETPPRAVIIIAGVNDIYQGLSAAHVTEQLRLMYNGAAAAAIRVVAGSILPFNTATSDQNRRMKEVNEWIRRYADGDGDLEFVDTRSAVGAPGRPDILMSSPDGLHPSVDGYRRIANALRPAIERVLG